MVCPVNPKRIKPAVDEEQTEAIGCPDDMGTIMEQLRSKDPTIRRAAARRMEVSSLGALNAIEMWRAANEE